MWGNNESSRFGWISGSDERGVAEASVPFGVGVSVDVVIGESASSSMISVVVVMLIAPLDDESILEARSPAKIRDSSSVQVNDTATIQGKIRIPSSKK